MHQTLSLTLCIIAKNEEKNIEQCIGSVKDIADEIIVVDTGSTDKTKDIARELGAKVFDFKWVDDFSAARNEALKHATKDWILVLDADETISKKDVAQLRQLLNDAACLGYYFVIRTYTDDSKAAGWVSSTGDAYPESSRASGWFSTRLIRLFRNDSRIRFTGIIHETIGPSIREIGEVKESPFPIHHFGRVNDRNGQKEQLYHRLGDLKLSQDANYHSYAQLGIQAQEAGNYEEAVGLFKQSLALNGAYFKAWLNLGACYLKLDLINEAEQALVKASSLEPTDYSTHNNLGIVYSQLGKAVLAVDEFLKAIKLNPKGASIYLNLGLALDSLGDKDKAYSAFKTAIELNPKYKDRIKLE